MFQSLSEKLENAFKKFRNKGKLTEADVKAGMREIKLALLEADVNFKVVKDFINTVSARAVGSEVLVSGAGATKSRYTLPCAIAVMIIGILLSCVLVRFFA